MSDDMLTERERWLIAKAFQVGHSLGYDCVDDWLADVAADAVTVEMVLVTEAPNDDDLR